MQQQPGFFQQPQYMPMMQQPQMGMMPMMVHGTASAAEGAGGAGGRKTPREQKPGGAGPHNRGGTCVAVSQS